MGAGNPYDASDLEILYVADAAYDNPAQTYPTLNWNTILTPISMGNTDPAILRKLGISQ